MSIITYQQAFLRKEKRVVGGLTDKGPSSHSESRQALAVDAVGRGQHCGGVNQRAAAEVLAILLKADDEGEVAGCGGDAAHDRGDLDVSLPLRDGAGGDGAQGCQAEEERFGGHGGWAWVGLRFESE